MPWCNHSFSFDFYIKIFFPSSLTCLCLLLTFLFHPDMNTQMYFLILKHILRKLPPNFCLPLWSEEVFLWTIYALNNRTLSLPTSHKPASGKLFLYSSFHFTCMENILIRRHMHSVKLYVCIYVFMSFVYQCMHSFF
jgi:hypothetical protein